MKEKKLDLFEYAKKVDAFSPKKGEVSKVLLNRLRGVRLSSIGELLEKKRAVKINIPLKNHLEKIELNGCENKKISFVRSAYSAYKCCQNQDLHLFQLKKIYIEKNLPLKGIIGWRFPKKRIIQEQLKSVVMGLKSPSKSYKNHTITWIVTVGQPFEKTSQEAQNYQIKKSIF